ncbi:unnamed protein product [Closterium sp. NIES-53]
MTTSRAVFWTTSFPLSFFFYAPWSGLCRMMDPLIDQVAGQFSGRASCFKMDTGESPNTLGEYGVRSLPTVKIFKAGREQKTLVGAVNDLTLHGALDDVI